MKLTIGQKILLGYGLGMLLMVITGIAGYRGLTRLLEANGWVRHTFVAIAAAENIRTGLLEAENAGRGYVVTGDAGFLESTAGFWTQIGQARAQLRALTSDNSAQQRRLDALDPLIDSEIADLASLSKTRDEKGLAAAQASL